MKRRISHQPDSSCKEPRSRCSGQPRRRSARTGPFNKRGAPRAAQVTHVLTDPWAEPAGSRRHRGGLTRSQGTKGH